MAARGTHGFMGDPAAEQRREEAVHGAPAPALEARLADDVLRGEHADDERVRDPAGVNRPPGARRERGEQRRGATVQDEERAPHARDRPAVPPLGGREIRNPKARERLDEQSLAQEREAELKEECRVHEHGVRQHEPGIVEQGGKHEERDGREREEQRRAQPVASVRGRANDAREEQRAESESGGPGAKARYADEHEQREGDERGGLERHARGAEERTDARGHATSLSQSGPTWPRSCKRAMSAEARAAPEPTTQLRRPPAARSTRAAISARGSPGGS